MTPRFVMTLALAAAISTAGAVFAYRVNNVFVPQAGIGEKMLPGLDKRINDVREIVIEQGLKKQRLVRKNATWQIAKTGFPVSADKVKQVLIGLVNLTKLEAKTANPKKYLLIDVDSPGKKGGRGRLFSLLDNNGKPVGQIVLGKTVVGKAGPGRDAQYARAGNEATSWLALGAVLADTQITWWVNPRFLKLDVDSIAKGKIVHADGEVVKVQRTGTSSSGSSTFEMLNVPAGRKTKSSTYLKFAATDFVNLDMVDVRPAKADQEPVSTAFIEDKEGLKLQLSMTMEKGNAWVQVKVLEKGKNSTLADEITARTDGWEFRVLKSARTAFERRNEDLLEKVK
jgi:hypothetical protein